jgi:hypothetical protein
MKTILKFVTQLILYQTHKTFGNSQLEICNSEFSDSFSHNLILMRRLLICILYTCLV